jgi:hypothetical protein
MSRLEMPDPYIASSPQCGLVQELFSGAVPVTGAMVLSCMPSFYNRLEPYGLEAFLQFSDQFSEQFSLPNDLLEFKDVTELVPKLFTEVDAISSSLGTFLGDLFGDKRVTLKRGLRTLGDYVSFWRNLDLTKRFGVDTLYADLDKSLNILQIVKQRLDMLRAYNGKPRRADYFRPIEWPDLQFTGNVYDNGFARSHIFGNFQPTAGLTRCQVMITCRQCRSIFRAHTLIDSHLEGLDRADALVKACLGSLGFYNGPKVLWNAIPYSFVFDYFANFSKLLGLLNAQPFSGRTEMFNTHWTLKTTLLFEVGVLFFGTDYYYAGEFPATQYLRALGLPMGLSSFAPLSPSEDQKLVMSELLDQKVRK